MGVCAPAPMWRSEDNFLELVSSYHGAPGLEPRLSGLAVDTLLAEPYCPPSFRF